MKKTIAILLIAVMALSFAACAKNAEKPAETVETPAASEAPQETQAPETPQPELDPAQAILGEWAFNYEATLLGLDYNIMQRWSERKADDFQQIILLNEDGTGMLTTVSNGETYTEAFTYKLQNNRVLAIQFESERISHVFALEGDRLSLYSGGYALVFDRK